MFKKSSDSDFLMKLGYTQKNYIFILLGPILKIEPSLLFHSNGPHSYNTISVHG